MKKKLSIGTILVAGWSLLLSSSCCVLEDRSTCPSLVRVLPTENVSEGISGEFVTKVESLSSGACSSMVFQMDEYYDGDVRFVLDREKDYRLLAFAGVKNMETLTDILQVPDWTPCDSLYIVRDRRFSIPAGAELLTLMPNSTKEHAVVRFTVTNYYDGYPYNFVLESAADGFFLGDGEPHYASHYSNLERIGETADFQTVVIRQKQGPLTLHVYDSGRHVGDIDLTAVLRSVSYDWDALNLEDIVFKIDFLAPDAVVTINGWTIAFHLDKIIL